MSTRGIRFAGFSCAPSSYCLHTGKKVTCRVHFQTELSEYNSFFSSCHRHVRESYCGVCTAGCTASIQCSLLTWRGSGDQRTTAASSQEGKSESLEWHTGSGASGSPRTGRETGTPVGGWTRDYDQTNNASHFRYAMRRGVKALLWLFCSASVN